MLVTARDHGSMTENSLFYELLSLTQSCYYCRYQVISRIFDFCFMQGRRFSSTARCVKAMNIGVGGQGERTNGNSEEPLMEQCG